MSCLFKETAQFTAALRCCCDNVMTDDNDMIIYGDMVIDFDNYDTTTKPFVVCFVIS